MVQPRKWLTGTSADQPLAETARQALSARLGMVWHYLVQATAQGVAEREAIHQLRVWSRRTVAALHTFDDTLPPRRAAWMYKQLRRVRQAAGEARDLDVLAQRFEERAHRVGAADVTHALGRLREDRRRAQRPIDRIHRRLRKKRFDRRVAGLIERISWRGDGPPRTLGTAARLRLGRAIGPFFEAAGGDLSDVTALHQLRIEGKCVRYAMELFAGAFEPAFRERLYPQVEELQERLGQINDHAAAAARFECWLSQTVDPAARDEFQRLLATERAAMRRARRGFFAWWTPERLSDLERGFTRALRDAGDKAAG